MSLVHDLPSALYVFLTAFVGAVGWHTGTWVLHKVLK